MAKWGEGDPRWIVEDRPDATNVNNWHWTEKNASDWSKKKFNELLVGLSTDFSTTSRDVIGDQSKSSGGADQSKSSATDQSKSSGAANDSRRHGGYRCTITEITRSDGDASANNRKAKLIFFFEWNLELKFEVDLRRKIDNDDSSKQEKIDNGEKFTGSIEIPNLSDENTADEIDLLIKCDQSGDQAFEIKEQIRKHLAPNVKKALGKYISDLKHEYGQNLILPTATKVSASSDEEKSIAPKSIDNNDHRNVAAETKNPPTKKDDSVRNEREKMENLGLNAPNFDTRDLSLTETFYCSPSDLYRAFVDPQMIQAFTRCPCDVEQPIGNEDRAGGRFKLYNGHVTGRFLELRPNQSIKMHWRMKTYPADHYSTVRLMFKQQNDSTVLKLEQCQIPADLYENTEDGWKRHYFEAMRQTFGFGSRLF